MGDNLTTYANPKRFAQHRLAASILLALATTVAGCDIHLGGNNEADVSPECKALACPAGCCSSGCVDLETDGFNCGACGVACGDNQLCDSGSCGCDAGYTDCDGVAENGCETEGACLCSLGEQEECYTGPADTEGVGACIRGIRTCLGDGWSDCTGQVVPQYEPCAPNGIDDDCNGVADDDVDADNDGWGRCQGDCCDSEADQCAQNPALVNPGAYDFPDNELDDDCDGTTDNVPQSECSFQPVTTGTNAFDLVQGMDLCQFTTGDPYRWGVHNATLTRADGTDQPNDLQTGVLNALGSRIAATGHNTMSVLSSGRARGVGDPGYPGWNDNSYSSTSGSVSAPAIFLEQNGGQLVSNPDCPSGNPDVYDSVRLRIELRVPTNALGIEFKFRFFSFEYPDFLCSEFNDFFVVLLDSQHPQIPADRNISFDSSGNPISINNAFFTTCRPLECFDPLIYAIQDGPDNDTDGCVDSLTCNRSTGLCEHELGACPDGAEDLLAFTTDPNFAGASSWLTTTAPVIPGELITLDFHIWDTGDDSLDSLVLLDEFRWHLEPTELITKF